MKKSLLAVFALAISIGPVLGEDEQDRVKQPKSRSNVAPAPKQQRVNPPPVRPRAMPQTPRVQQNVNVSPRFRNKVLPPTNRVQTPNLQAPKRTFTPPDQDAVRAPTTVRSDADLSNSNWRNRTRKQNPPPVVAPEPPQTPTARVDSDTTVRNRDRRNRDRNRTDRNRDWQNNNTSGVFTYDQARRRHHRQRHDRSWWRSRYNRIALFAGGYYYWDNNYWYPAYGYDPYYSTYTYDEPIYGYNDLPPGQVIANVQAALQEQGYYRDAVDGLIGPRTRAALSDFQRDHGLPITAAIDGPTLKALRLY
jgi:hypothetical protein